MTSFVTPLIFLLNIGMAIVFNLGSNVFLGEISYITQALAAVLQLAVTMDYSIFLLESYEANKERYEAPWHMRSAIRLHRSRQVRSQRLQDS